MRLTRLKYIYIYIYEFINVCFAPVFVFDIHSKAISQQVIFNQNNRMTNFTNYMILLLNLSIDRCFVEISALFVFSHYSLNEPFDDFWLLI